MARRAPKGISGVGQTINTLNQKLAVIENKTLKGIMRAGLLIQRESKLNAPYDEGNLENSSFVRNVSNDKGPMILIGFAAEYAAYAHESPYVGIKKGGPKFLEKAIKENQSKIVTIIAEEAKVE
jgi:hypothetical protein